MSDKSEEYFLGFFLGQQKIRAVGGGKI